MDGLISKLLTAVSEIEISWLSILNNLLIFEWLHGGLAQHRAMPGCSDLVGETSKSSWLINLKNSILLTPIL
jgi:hypothetical protein